MKYSKENAVFDGHLNKVGLGLMGISFSTSNMGNHLWAIIILITTMMMLFAQTHQPKKRRAIHKTTVARSFKEEIASIGPFLLTLFNYEKDMVSNNQVRRIRPYFFGFFTFVIAYGYHIIKLMC